MGRHHNGSDIDLCLEVPPLSHADRLSLMSAVDELLFLWSVELLHGHEISGDLTDQIHRVDRCL